MNQELAFGGYIRQRRREMDLTQEELARRVGCAAITLRKIEADDLRASVQIAERLAMALAIPLEERSEFVRWARSVRPASSELPPLTPPPSIEEIGREDLTGRAIRGYALAERIGMGGMGSVYRAVQPNVEREVAVKIILPAFANHPDFIRRFEAEAQLVARLEHPHIVPLYDYWREPGVAYLVMRFLRGGNIQNLLGQGALSVETTTHVLGQICSALNAAHRIGVIHRDLKPANVLLDEDVNAYLADFGIAKNLGDPDLENQTHVDAMIGSPQYMSPEQIRSLSVRPQTDIYCLGVMLYEMLTGALPFTGPTPFDMIQQHISTPMPPLSAHRPGLPAALDAVITRATAKDPQDRHTDTLSFFQDFRRAVDGVVNVHPVTVAYEEEEPDLEVTNPFKGLRAFGEADAENFFGRETLIQQLLARLGEGGDLSRFLAVIGPSGSGKSSVVRAGLIPALRRGGLPGSENWFVVDMLPGKHPFEELEASLLRVAVNPPESLLAQLKDGNRGLLRAVHRILPADESVELVLLIDQFEEVFTLVEYESERALLLESLAAAVLDERSRLHVIITLRADFTDRPLRYVDFGELLNRRFEFVLPLTADEVERAVAGPAQRVGLRLEKGLVSTIIREAGNQPGTLPLLQYALSELFEKREGRLLTNKAYRKIGGVISALGRRAEMVFGNLDQAGQSAARQLFLRLVTLGEGTEDTRRRALRVEIEALHGEQQVALQHVIEAFGRARLLSFDHDPLTRGATIEVAHEALLREWLRLREWLDESRADVRLQRQLATAAQDWENAGHDLSFLMTGSRLEQFEGWSANTTIALTQTEQSYLEASIMERDRRDSEELARGQRELKAAQKLAETERSRAEEQAHSANRLRIRNRVITTVGSIAIILALLAGLFGVRADSNFDRAEAQRLALEANRLVLSGGGSEQIALLSLRSMKIHYTPEGDAALAAAARLEYPVTSYNQKGIVWSVALSRDGKYVLTASDDTTATVWDLRSGQALRSFIGHTAGIVRSSFSPDGKTVLTTSFDGSIRLWDAATGQEASRIVTDTPLRFMVYLNDGKTILTSSGDKTIRRWDAASGKEVGVFLETPEVVWRMAISPDDKILLTLSSTAQLWDLQSGQEMREFPFDVGPIQRVDFSPNGNYVLTGNTDGQAYLWDVKTGNEVRTFIGHTGPIYSMTFSPDNKYVLTSAGDKTVRIWDINTGQELRRFTFPGYVSGLAVSLDSKWILIGGDDGSTNLWALDAKAYLPVLNHGAGVNAVAFSPDGKVALTGGSDGTARLWDAVTGERLRDLAGHTDVINFGAAFSPDGKHIVTGSWDATVRLWDARTGEQVHQFVGDTGNIHDAVYSPDGRTILTAGEDGVRLRDVQTEEEIRKFGDIIDVYRATFSPDGKYVLTSGSSTDGVARLWETSTGQMIREYQSAPGDTGSVDFSPDGKRIIADGGDNIVHLWDTKTGKELRQYIGHTSVVFTAVFSPDGKYIATASVDNTARLWDVQTGQELRRFIGHAAGVENVAFSPDGKTILTGSDDGTARLWDVDYHTTIDYLCSRLLRDFTEEERAQYGITDDAPTCPPR